MSILDDQRDKLITDIDESLGLIVTANSLSSSTGLTINFNIRQIEQITEWVFVNVHTGWEKFLEDSFLSYMTGTQTLSGFTPVRYVLPKDIEHALKLILAGRDFFQWSQPKRVCEQAELCFENGVPFKALIESTTVELSEMTTIRNAIVHRSSIAKEKFKTLVRNKMKTAPPDVTPGQFLAMLMPKTTNETFIAFYCKKLKVIATKIVPN
jgi:hypothetical protein